MRPGGKKKGWQGLIAATSREAFLAEIMSEQCDRCRSSAAYRVMKGKAELFLCGMHARVLYKSLEKNGWTFFPDGLGGIAPQAKEK